MKKIYFLLILVITVGLIFGSCTKMLMEPNLPASYDGRPVKEQGTVYVSNRKVSLKTWVKNAADGSIITLIMNDKVVLSNYALEGISHKKEIEIKFDHDGYNYLLLFINNAGSQTPEEATFSIDDGTGEQEMVLTSDLTFCGAMNIYVQ